MPKKSKGIKESSRPLWTCPKCGRRFANRNQAHSCAKVALGEHFAGKDPLVRVIFDALLEAARRHGEFDVVSNATRIVFRSRMSSINAVPRKDHLKVGLCLGRSVDDPIFSRVTTYSARNHLHELSLACLADLSPRFLELLEEACAVGRQEHLAQPADEGLGPQGFWKVHSKLLEEGLLLETDPALPSVAGLVAGGPVRGSWWSHPRGRAIYAVCEALREHPDVVTAKLVNGKVTYVHRRMWQAFHRLATEGEAWQTKGLSTAAKRLLARVERLGRVEATGADAEQLEKRLLVHAVSIHTERGSHAKQLESWPRWCDSAHFAQRAIRLDTARARLERIAAVWRERTGTRVLFPWTDTGESTKSRPARPQRSS